MPEAAIGLGSNLGDKAANLKAAVVAIAGASGVTLRAASAIYRTAPWGGVDQDSFLNACILVETSLSPRDLLALCQDVERRGGRERRAEQRWGPRTLDADILFYGDSRVNEADLVIPHPIMMERAFVLVPLADLAPDQEIDGISIRDRVAVIDRTGVEQEPDVQLV